MNDVGMRDAIFMVCASSLDPAIGLIREQHTTTTSKDLKYIPNRRIDINVHIGRRRTQTATIQRKIQFFTRNLIPIRHPARSVL